MVDINMMSALGRPFFLLGGAAGMSARPACGSGKLTSSILGLDSTMLKQACHCTRCSLGSWGDAPNVPGAVEDDEKINFNLNDGLNLNDNEENGRLKC